MTPWEFAILGLATWRVSSLLVNEEGPLRVFYRLREAAGIRHDEFGKPELVPESLLAGILSCIWCASVWVGVGWIVFYLLLPQLAIGSALVFALSTMAIGIGVWLK